MKKNGNIKPTKGIKMTLDEILQASFTDLFPEGTKKEYRTLLKLTHPDLHPNDTDKAQQAFVHVTTIWINKGKTEPTVNKTQTQPKNTIYTKRNTYLVTKTKTVNNIAYYTAETAATTDKTTLQLAVNPEASKRLHSGTQNLKKVRTALEEHYQEFFPKTVDVFNTKHNNEKLFGIVTTPNQENWYTLEEVLKRYPTGIQGENIAWMYRRALVALGLTHDNGFYYGAPVLNAIQIQPEKHGFMLTDWQYSVEQNKDMTSLPNSNLIKHYQKDKKGSIQKDLTILSEEFVKLMDKRTPRQLRMFIRGMSLAPTKTALDGLIEFEQTLTEVYGTRKFHTFTMK